MAGSKDCLKDRLSHYRRIKISVIGRNFGRTISIPVWFVLQWYKNVLLNPQTRLEARGARRPVAAPPRHGAAVNLVLVSSTLTDLDSPLRRAQNSC
jgi:hypothetical protein